MHTRRAHAGVAAGGMTRAPRPGATPRQRRPAKALGRAPQPRRPPGLLGQRTQTRLTGRVEKCGAARLFFPSFRPFSCPPRWRFPAHPTLAGGTTLLVPARALAVRAPGGLQTRRRRCCSPRIGIRLDHRSGGAPRRARGAAVDTRTRPAASRAEQADDRTGGDGQLDWVLDRRRHRPDRRTPLVARLSDRHCGVVVPLRGHGRGSSPDLGSRAQSMIVKTPPRRKRQRRPPRSPWAHVACLPPHLRAQKRMKRGFTQWALVSRTCATERLGEDTLTTTRMPEWSVVKLFK